MTNKQKKQLLKNKKESKQITDQYINDMVNYIGQSIVDTMNLVLTKHTPESIFALANQELNPVYWDLKDNIQQVITNAISDYKIPKELLNPNNIGQIVEYKMQELIDILKTHIKNLKSQFKKALTERVDLTLSNLPTNITPQGLQKTLNDNLLQVTNIYLDKYQLPESIADSVIADFEKGTLDKAVQIFYKTKLDINI